MPVYTQDNRDLQIIVNGKEGKDSSGNDNVLLAEVLEGSYEALGAPYSLYLKVLTPAVNSPLTVEEMLGRNITVKLRNSVGGWRFFNGVITDFIFEGYYCYETRHKDAVSNTDLYQYRVTLRPKMYLLKNSRKNRVFHNVSPRTIIKNILSAWKIDFLDGLESSSNEVKKYYEFEQCVQFEESDFDFISRLMEAEGVFYSFWQGEDEKKGPMHKMILHDSNSVADMKLKFDPGGPENAVHKFALGESVAPDAVRIDDYDFKQADVTFFNYDDTSVNQKTDLGSYAKNMLMNDFDAGFTVMKSKADASKYRKKLKVLAAQRLRSMKYKWHGVTANRLVAAGTAFTLSEFPGGNLSGIITSLSFRAKTTPFAVSEAALNSDDLASFSAEFYAQDLSQPYRPELKVKTPKIDSTLSARVITVESLPAATNGNVKSVSKAGAAATSALQFGADLGGNPVGVDSSTCRVKILMNWRNTGADSSPDFGSMWLNARFGQIWADPTSGKFEIPRKGQEVMVNFINGNPALPVVVGSLYNSVIAPPIDLKSAQGIYGSFMRNSSISSSSESPNIYEIPASLENEMPLPMAVYDLGKKDKQKKYSQISIFNMDNGKFSEPKVRDDTFMTKWFFPAGEASVQQLVDDCEKIHKGGGSSGGSSMFFEGINMYSNKDVLNQSAQSQFLNAGKDVQICAANSITLQVGRSKITIKDDGVSMKTGFGDPVWSTGYIEDYRGGDPNAPKLPEFSIPSFGSSVSVMPGTTGITAPNCFMQGSYSASIKTWFGSKLSGDIGASGIRGMTTSVRGGASLKSMLGDIASLVGKMSKDLNSFSQSDADTVGTDTMGALSSLYSQLLMTYNMFMNVLNTIKMIKNMFSLKSSAISLKYNAMSKSSDKITLDSPKIDVNGNILGAYIGVVDEMSANTIPGLDDAIKALASFAAITKTETNVAEINSTAIKKSEMEADQSKTALLDENGNVIESDTSGANTETNAMGSDVEVSSTETGVISSDQSVSDTELSATSSDVSGVDNETTAASMPTNALIVNTSAMDLET
ncbi:MAG: hypothetical protein GY750_06275 [Lentisphaerae bacterium]|nr:hypothetical protein [Lentisphaerota bacterium]MCP4101014.1 hypothetical protein [Lentisphaerota bacterium]